MSNDSTKPSNEAEQSNEELGPVILTCRPLSPMRWVAAQGLGLLGAYVLMPFGVLPFFAAIPAGAVLFLFNGPPLPTVALVCGATVFLVVYLALIWLVYLQPRGDHLVLHRDGFRLKITFKRRQIRFAQLRAITFGIESTAFQALLRGFGYVQPGQASGQRELANAAVNFTFHDGSKTTFKSFLHRFEEDDLRQFFTFISEHHSRLLPPL